jgi:hypothetical protein
MDLSLACSISLGAASIKLSRRAIEDCQANPKLLVGVTGADRYMQGGRAMTKDDYMKRRRAFNKKYGV